MGELIASFIMKSSVINFGIKILILCLSAAVIPAISDTSDNREGKDLVYEGMKMRTGNWKSWDPNRVQIVGGGILEKKMLGERGGMEELGTPQHESREMQCCDELTVESFGEINQCHPYVLGDYKKIGSCQGKSFYQHKNTTDIFLYHACGAWYLGLEIGVCGGWVLAKSQEICVTSRHESTWKFFNNGVLQEDPSFQILAKCTFQSDFFPVPEQPINAPQSWPSQQQRPQQIYPQYNPHVPVSSTQSSFNNQASTSVKHEHFHYHYPTKDSHSSGNHPKLDQNKGALVQTLGVQNGLNGRTGIITGHGQYEFYSKPIEIQPGNTEKYKHQYKGQPYKKRAEDEAYFPMGEDVSSKLEAQSLRDKNNRNLE